MLTKNNKFFIISCVLGLLTLITNLKADEFNISASNITFDKENNTVLGKGSVEVIDSQGRIIKGDKVIYEKTKEIVIVDGNVEVF